MSRIRSGDTKPELVVRSLLHGMGYRYRLHVKDLPGKPDIVLRRFKAVIFVNGCFWHQHGNCRDGKIPKSNRKYWRPKLERNLARDKTNKMALRELGWRTCVIWECQIKNQLPYVRRRLKRFLPR